MNWIRSLRPRTGFAGRLQLAGLLIAAGIAVELGTLYWNHPISLFLFLTVGAGLVVAGMLLYLWSVVTRSK